MKDTLNYIVSLRLPRIYETSSLKNQKEARPGSGLGMESNLRDGSREEHKFEASLKYIARPYLKNNLVP